MPTSDKRHRLVYGKKPKEAGNPTSNIELVVGDETIKCRPVLDGLTILEFANIPQAEEGEELSPEEAQLAAQGILNLFQAAVVDYGKFKAAIRKAGVEIDELGEMAGDLVEAYTAERPTQ